MGIKPAKLVFLQGANLILFCNNMIFKKFIALFSILYLLFFFCAVATDLCASVPNNEYTKLKCIVIDPGHGGKHPGAISKVGNIKEKDITLSVALKLGKLIKDNYPDVKVVYTRTNDVYVDLDVRAAIANKNKADLFLSIHCNSAASAEAHGTETFVMGTSKSPGNFDVCKRENSVITVEDNYKAKYEGFNPSSPESYIIFSLLQNTHLEQSLIFASYIQDNFSKGPIKYNRGVKQGGLLVLWKTTMPAVLTEIGFLSNAKDRAVLNSKAKQQEIASALYNAFVKYKEGYEGGESVGIGDLESKESKESKEGKESKESKESRESREGRESRESREGKESVGIGVGDLKSKESRECRECEKGGVWGVQVMSVAKKLNCSSTMFKGVPVVRYRVGNTYKYIHGSFATKEEALVELTEIRKKFPEAFITKMKDYKPDK